MISVMGDPDLAFAVMMAGIVGLYTGLCGRIVIGVAGGVMATVGLASLVRVGPPHAWFALAVFVPFATITVFLLRTALRARRNKQT
jgi:hypothetical protein